MKKLSIRYILSGLAVAAGVMGCVVCWLMGMDFIGLLPLACIVLIPMGMAGFIYGMKGACYGALIAAVFLSGIVENDWLDSPPGGFFKNFTLLAAWIGIDEYFKWRKKRYPDEDEEEAEDWYVPGRALQEALEEIPADSLMVKTSGDALFQLYRGANQLYIVRIGSVQEPEREREILSEEAFIPSRKNDQINLSDIEEVLINTGQSSNPRLKIRTREKTRRFRFLEFSKREEIDRFFDGLPVREVKNSLSSTIDPPEPTEEQIRRYAPHRKVAIGLATVCGLCAALWLFTELNYRLFTALNLVITAVAFIAYCVGFGASQPINPTKRVQYTTWIFQFLAIAQFYRILFDFHIDDPLLAAKPAAILALTGIAVFSPFAWRKKPELDRVITVLGAVAVFSALAVFQLNFLLDDGSRATMQDEVMRYKSVHRQIFFPTRFDLYISGVNGETYHVPRAFYDVVEEGDTVTVVTRTGALGIPYSFVVPAGSSGETWSP